MKEGGVTERVAAAAMPSLQRLAHVAVKALLPLRIGTNMKVEFCKLLQGAKKVLDPL